MAGQHELLELDLWFSGGTGHAAPGLTLVDSGASHNFLSERVALAAGLCVDRSCHLNVKLADGEQRASLGLARGVQVTFAPGVVQPWDFWVVPLAMDAILGAPWLRGVQPAIDWKIQRVMWEQSGSVVTVFGRGGLPPAPPTPSCTIVSAKRFLRDAQHGTLGDIAFVGLIQPSVTTRGVSSDATAACNVLSVDMAGSTSDQAALEQMLSEFADVFEKPGQPPPARVQHKIDLIDDAKQPPRHRCYRMSQPELDELKKQIDSMLEKGWIAPSTSPYGHPVLFARKKDGSLRLCVDFRSLNANTRLDRYPLPRIDELLDRLNGHCVFSSLDLQCGYHQICIAPEHQHRAAFACKYGLFEFKVMPFGLTNAPSTFQRFMHDTLKGLSDFADVYLDDILVFSKSVPEHLEHVRTVLQRLRDKKLQAKRSKCDFLRSSLQFLGHIVSGQGVAPDPEKVEAIAKLSAPTDVPTLRSFLGCCNYYERFVPRYAHISAPLTDLLCTGAEWLWGPAQQAAFDQLKQALCSAPVLILPNMRGDFVVETDASDYCIGGVLNQDQGQGLQPVAYYSKKLTGAPRNYPTHERELLAIVVAIKKWRPYLDGKCTRVLTDHGPLVNLPTQPYLSPRQVCWMEFLSAYKLSLEYRPGHEAVVPDALSRLHTVVLEPGWLPRVSCCQHSDPELAPLIVRAQSHDGHYRLHGGGEHPTLYRVLNDSEVLVLPAKGGFREIVLRELHDSALGGHLGAEKTLLALQQRVWWPCMRAHVDAYVAGCPTCQRVKDRTQRPPGPLQPLEPPASRFSDYTMDFVFGLPLSHGFNGIMTVVDRATKRVVLTPVHESITAPKVADLFLQHVVRVFGMPKCIISDRDPRFMSHFWQHLFRKLGTCLLHSSANHPQTDGQSERAHQVIEQILRSYVFSCPDTWDERLLFCEMCINSHANSSTTMSPNLLTFGQEVQEPLDLVTGVGAEAPAAVEVADRIHRLMGHARECVKRAQKWQKDYYDKKHRPLEFTVGSQVLLSTSYLRMPGGRKLGPRWIGPFRVSARVGMVAYRLELPSQYKFHNVFHVSLLKGYNDSGADRAEVNPAPIVLEPSGDQEFEVERIIGHRHVGRNWALQFLVKWRGYDVSDATWEPASHLKNAPICVQKYWASHSQEPP